MIEAVQLSPSTATRLRERAHPPVSPTAMPTPRHHHGITSPNLTKHPTSSACAQWLAGMRPTGCRQLQEPRGTYITGFPLPLPLPRTITRSRSPILEHKSHSSDTLNTHHVRRKLLRYAHRHPAAPLRHPTTRLRRTTPTRSLLPIPAAAIRPTIPISPAAAV